MKKIVLSFLLLLCLNINSQVTDTTIISQAEEQPVETEDADRYKTKLGRSLIVPGLLIGYGLTTIHDNGLYSSFDARRDVLKLFGGRQSTIDNILIFAPYVEFGVLTLLKIKCKNDLINTSILILKSELLMAAIVFPMKQLTRVERPYSYFSETPDHEKDKNSNAFHSLPSGHTAQAFVAASVLHKEFRHLSPWYGIGAYTIATSVAVFRIANDKHWMSDVIVGAGIGLLATHVSYATHQHRWGRKEICLVPYPGGASLVCRF